MTDQSQKSPYENVLAGNFILALGHKLGAAGKSADALFANFFQQTPMDQFLADLMAESDFRGFLLEFKRDWTERLAEAKKEKFKIISSDQKLVNLAKKCHLLDYCVGHRSAPRAF